MQRVILRIADQLDLPPGDVQYATAKCRLGGAPLQLDDHLALTGRIWRERSFGPPARGKPGTVVKIKSGSQTQLAYLCRGGNTARVFYDTGGGYCTSQESVTPRIPLEDFVPSRLWMPYGFWVLRDGSEVVFSRDYIPLWRILDGVTERIDPWLWITNIVDQKIIATRLFWESAPARVMALDHLAERRIFELPRLVHAMPHLIGNDEPTVLQSVKSLRQEIGAAAIPPAYAILHPHAS